MFKLQLFCEAFQHPTKASGQRCWVWWTEDIFRQGKSFGLCSEATGEWCCRWWICVQGRCNKKITCHIAEWKGTRRTIAKPSKDQNLLDKPAKKNSKPKHNPGTGKGKAHDKLSFWILLIEKRLTGSLTPVRRLMCAATEVLSKSWSQIRRWVFISNSCQIVSKMEVVTVVIKHRGLYRMKISCERVTTELPNRILRRAASTLAIGV